jgi:hypothetical protein
VFEHWNVMIVVHLCTRFSFLSFSTFACTLAVDIGETT